MIVRATTLAGVLLAASSALAAPGSAGLPPARGAVQLPPGATFRKLCRDGSCRSLFVMRADGTIHATAAPRGIGADDIELAYRIDTSRGDGQTVAIVDAYGYAALESDLAAYRAQFGLPPCTEASGCLTVLNEAGATSPLPPDDDGWIGETSLDVQMVSAACPKCKIVVIQTGAPGFHGLDFGQKVAAKLDISAISDSWGGDENGTEPQEEGDFNNPGVGTFVSTGDNGYTGATPSYPATSNFVIAVGGTTILASPGDPRGFREAAWGGAGSSCSTSIPKPAYQPAYAVCGMRANSDISAVADPNTGVAVFVKQFGGWTIVGGTSAAAPITAGLMTGAGHGDATPEFVYKHPEAFNDISTGMNGSCGTNLCNAGTAWDGPTGLGTPDQVKLAAIGNVVGAGPDITVTYPEDGATVGVGFTIDVTSDAPDAQYAVLTIDGQRVGARRFPATEFSAPFDLADGSHTVQVTAFDLDHNSKSTMLTITQATATSDGGGGGGGCAAGGSGSTPGALALALGALLARRQRR